MLEEWQEISLRKCSRSQTRWVSPIGVSKNEPSRVQSWDYKVQILATLT